MQKQSFLGAEHFVLQNVRKSLFGAEHFVEQNVQHQIDLAPKCSALHFVLQNVMPCKNAFGAKMHSVRCKNVFLQRVYFVLQNVQQRTSNARKTKTTQKT